MKSKRPNCNLTKVEMATALVEALNALNSMDRDDWSDELLGVYHTLVDSILTDADVRSDFANNGTLYVRDLIRGGA